MGDAESCRRYTEFIYGYAPLGLLVCGGCFNTLTIVTLWSERKASPPALLLIILAAADTWVLFAGTILFVNGECT